MCYRQTCFKKFGTRAVGRGKRDEAIGRRRNKYYERQSASEVRDGEPKLRFVEATSRLYTSYSRSLIPGTFLHRKFVLYFVMYTPLNIHCDNVQKNTLLWLKSLRSCLLLQIRGQVTSPTLKQSAIHTTAVVHRQYLPKKKMSIRSVITDK